MQVLFWVLIFSLLFESIQAGRTENNSNRAPNQKQCLLFANATSLESSDAGSQGNNIVSKRKLFPFAGTVKSLTKQPASVRQLQQYDRNSGHSKRTQYLSQTCTEKFGTQSIDIENKLIETHLYEMKHELKPKLAVDSIGEVQKSDKLTSQYSIGSHNVAKSSKESYDTLRKDYGEETKVEYDNQAPELKQNVTFHLPAEGLGHEVREELTASIRRITSLNSSIVGIYHELDTMKENMLRVKKEIILIADMRNPKTLAGQIFAGYQLLLKEIKTCAFHQTVYCSEAIVKHHSVLKAYTLNAQDNYEAMLKTWQKPKSQERYYLDLTTLLKTK